MNINDGKKLNELEKIVAVGEDTQFLVQTGANDAQKAIGSDLKTFINVSGAVTASINNHTGADDPHRDREYTDLKINVHAEALDPHDDRAYSDGELSLHVAGNDPHGDRAYSDNKLTAHKNEVDGHGHKAYTDGIMQDHKSEVDPHGYKAYIAAELNAIKGQEDGYAPLDDTGTIPAGFLPATSSVVTTGVLPATGQENRLYIDSATFTGKVWNSSTSSFETLKAAPSATFTTDDIAQGSSPNRRYYTTTVETDISDRISARISSGTSVGAGLAVFKSRAGSSLQFKSLLAGGGISIAQDATNNTLIISKIEEATAIETEATNFIIRTVTNSASLSKALTTDGEVAGPVFENCLPLVDNGVTVYTGQILVTKVTKGSGLEQTDKFNKSVGQRLWDITVAVRIRTNWTSPTTTAVVGEILTQTITEVDTGATKLTDVQASLSISVEEDALRLVINGTSQNVANTAYLWKGTLKRTGAEHNLEGIVDYAD